MSVEFGCTKKTAANRVFPLLYKVGNIGNEGLLWEKETNSAKKLPPVGKESGASFFLL